MRRTNTIALAPTHEQSKKLHYIADACARLWNEITYRRRQSFFSGMIDWMWRDLYDEYKKIVGAATAQQIERKNSVAWRSFFALLKLKKKGRLQPHIKIIRPPGYWKDRSTKKRKQMILIRKDLYRFRENQLFLPKRMRIKWCGNPRWANWIEQGQLSVIYNQTKGKWYAHQPVKVRPSLKPRSTLRAFIDLGVINLLTIAVEGERQIIACSGRPALSDWWYLSNRINWLKSIAKTTNQQESSYQIQRLFRRRQLRFRHYVNTIVHRAIKDLWQRGVSTIVMGDLAGILLKTRSGRKNNAMLHNFWSHRYIVKRLQEVTEEYGIIIRQVNERGTSSKCPRCGSKKITRRKRLLKCQDCKLEAHRDGVGAINIGLAQGANFPREVVNGAVACPLEVSV